jgi:hypothetical protein
MPSKGSTCHNAPSLRLFVPNSIQAYRHFFSEGCACDVCDWPRLLSPWHDPHGNYSPTAPAAHSLRQLVPSGSLIRFEPVQCTTIIRDLGFHCLYTTSFIRIDNLYSPLPMWIGAWVISPPCGLDDRATHRRPVITSFHLVTGQLQVLEGITVDAVYMVGGCHKQQVAGQSVIPSEH